MALGKNRLVDLEARLVAETPKARKFDFGGKEKVWLAKSQHEWDEDAEVVTFLESLAIEKGVV